MFRREMRSKRGRLDMYESVKCEQLLDEHTVKVW